MLYDWPLGGQGSRARGEENFTGRRAESGNPSNTTERGSMEGATDQHPGKSLTAGNSLGVVLYE